MSTNEYLEFIINQTGRTKDEVIKMVVAKHRSENVNILDSYKLVCDELKLDFENNNNKNKKEEIYIVEDKQNDETLEEDHNEENNSIILAPLTPSGMVPADTIKYPSEQEIRLKIKRLQFVKQQLITKKDWEIINGKKHLNRSAVQKYINAFGITIEILEGPIFLERKTILEEYDENPLKDVGVRYRIKAIAPTGQYVMSDGTKFKSEYWSKQYHNFGSYNEHNLTATAITRATKHAVLDLIGYGEEETEE